MTIEIALALLAAAIPLTALVVKFSGSVKPTDFVQLKTEFRLFREEVRAGLTDIKTKLEK